MKLVALLPISVIAMALGCEASPRVPPQLASAGDVRSITLETLEPGAERKVVIDDPSSVKGLVALAVFKPQPPCGCGPFERVVFHTAHGPVTAFLSGHCIGFFEGNSVANYEMSPAFREKYLELLNSGHAANGR